MFNEIKASLIFLILFSTAGFGGLDSRSLEATSMFYGAADCAVNDNMVSVFMNPAGLYHMLNSELMINVDRSYGFNYAAAGHFFRGFGNLALACFNDIPGGRQVTAMGWGARIAGTDKGVYQHLLIAGLNAQAIFMNSSDVFFSMNPGLLYLLRSEEKGLRDLSIGISSAGLFDHSSSFTWQTGISVNFRVLKQRDFLLAFGTDFDTPFKLKTWAFGLEMELLRPLYFGLGGGSGVLSTALNLKWINDILYFSGTYNILTRDIKASVTYRRIVQGVPTRELPRRKTALKQTSVRKNNSSQKTNPETVSKITEELLERQKDFLQEGVRHYTDNELYPAIEEWKKVIEISPDTEYGKQAAGYIDICEAELKGLKAK